jgi:L-alanine-DL-glutamate epimerase-like enolase superfamily enzyme
MKMKVGVGPEDDLKLVRAVRDAVGKDFQVNGRCKSCL